MLVSLVFVTESFVVADESDFVSVVDPDWVLLQDERIATVINKAKILGIIIG